MSKPAKQDVIDVPFDDGPKPLAKISDAGSIMQIIGAAVQQLGGEGAKDAASAIETLVKLKREEDDRQARRDFFAAMNEFRQACPVIPRDKVSEQTTRNGGTRRMAYAPLSTIERYVKPILNRLGFSYRWDTDMLDATQMKVTCYLMHAAGHTESANMFVTVDKAAPMNATQQNGSTRSYGMRYSLEQVLGISTSEDSDGTVPDPSEAERIEEDQAATLAHLLQESGRDERKFLEWIGAKRIDDIALRDYKRAEAMLRRAAGK